MILMKKIAAIYLICILVLGSLISAGIFFLKSPDEVDDKIDNDKTKITDDNDGSLSPEVKERWKKYTDSVDSPEVITTDPDIVKVRPGEALEQLAQLEGLNEFKDTDDGSSGANTTSDFGSGSEGAGAGDNAEPPAKANDDLDDGSSGEREVEEADLVKIIGDTMYVLNSYRGLIAIDISDPENSHIEGQCSVIGYPVEMYVVDFLAIITVRTDYNFWYRYWELDGLMADIGNDPETGTIGTMIYIVNVDDPSDPTILKIVELVGYPSESRRVGNVIYQATNIYNYYWYNEYEEKTIVSSIDFSDPETVGLVDQEEFQGSTNQVHASQTAFYIARPKYEYEDDWEPWGTYEYYTQVTYLDISDPKGEIERKDTFKVPGFLNNKYQMDEYNHMFRMVTHFWTGIGESKLYIFDVSNPAKIYELGNLLVDDAGSLMATRFAGERAYTIHLPRSVDPLDVLDLSDPTNPKLCDVFEMPGWVTHMEVYGNMIIALGVDDSDGQRNVAVSLFDVTDPYEVEMLDRKRLGGDYAYSSANWEPKALTIDDDHNMVIVPYSSYDRTTWEQLSGIQLVGFDLDTGKLSLRGFSESKYSIDRTRVVDDYIFATSFKTMQVIDVDDLDKPDTVKIIELCINVKDIVPAGEFYLQMVQDWYDDKIVLRTVEYPDDLAFVDSASVETNWGKLFDTNNGLIMAANPIEDNNYVGALYKITVDNNGKISVNKIGMLPHGITFTDYHYYGYGGYYLEDDVGIGVRSSTRYNPYYYSFSGERYLELDDMLIYYHTGTHPYSNWVYNYTLQQYLPTEEKAGKDTLFIFDLSDMAEGAILSSVDIEVYSLMGMTNYQDTVYIQHRKQGIDFFNDSKGTYWNWYYQSFALEVDLSDLSRPSVSGNYNVPGKIFGAGDGVLFTISEWSGADGNVTINTLTLHNDTATITSAAKIGTGSWDVTFYNNKAYLVKSPDYYYYYYYYDLPSNSNSDMTTEFQVIDLSVPDEPMKELSVTLDGNMRLVQVGSGHLAFYDQMQSSISVYSDDSLPDLDFEAMILIRGGYENIRLYDDAVFIPQGYYGVAGTEL